MIAEFEVDRLCRLIHGFFCLLLFCFCFVSGHRVGVATQGTWPAGEAEGGIFEGVGSNTGGIARDACGEQIFIIAFVFTVSSMICTVWFYRCTFTAIFVMCVLLPPFM